MKNWFVSACTYNRFGGHSTLSLLAEFFLKDLPDFGPALQELSTNFHFAHAGPPKATLEDRFQKFQAERARLPKVVFQRARQKAQIDFASDLMSGHDLERYGEYKLQWFNKGAQEIVENLQLLLGRFKKSDLFDFDAFLLHCTTRLNDLPANEESFTTLVAELNAQDKARRESLSDWDRLGIDFRDFHPEARRILDDPFYWDPTDDFAPHGNDTGADVLGDYQEWLQHHDPKGAPEFLSDLLASWGIEDGDLMSQQAVIGLAFAELKLRSVCHPTIRQNALQALDSQAKIIEKHTEDILVPEWRRRIDQLKAKLESVR